MTRALRAPSEGTVTIPIVRFCAEECERQRSGELSVLWMVQAHYYAMGFADRKPTVTDVLVLGRLVEPNRNHDFRKVGVRVGWDVKQDWQTVWPAMRKLMDSLDNLTSEEFFQEYETIHPFVDGNGRTGAILFNWLRESLNAPVTAPKYVERVV